MKLLYIGDVMGRPGRALVAKHLPSIKRDHSIDTVLLQAENVTHGKGMGIGHYRELKSLGVDGFMSGNHIFARDELVPLLSDPSVPITRPANYPEDTPGMRYKIITTKRGKLLLVSLLGQVVGKDADKPMQNPLHVIDELLEAYASEVDMTVVNFHGDYSSEKVVIGQYLDGRVAAVVGDHWHVPTADARVLPGGTAHITDVGMVGTLNSSLGIKTETIVARWRGEAQGRNELIDTPPYQFCAVVIDIDETTGHSREITQIIEYYS